MYLTLIYLINIILPASTLVLIFEYTTKCINKTNIHTSFPQG